MRLNVNAYKVTSLNKVDTTLYVEGDIFYTNRSIGVLHNGKIKKINQQDLTDYAKKDDIPDVSDFVTESDVQTMIDDALNNQGG